MIRSTLSFIFLAACATSPTAQSENPNHLDWLTGCWQSEDGATREVWSTSEGGYLFGYSVVAQDGAVVFFEQMRIDPGETPVFNAYPRGAGPSAFPALEQTTASVTFANPEHDFPQRIQYERDGDELNAEISKIDGSNTGTFNYLPCPAD